MSFTIKATGTHNVMLTRHAAPLVLRDVLGMTGTKFGWHGALRRVHGAHRRRRDPFCITTIDSIGGSAITTIEAVGATQGPRSRRPGSTQVVQCGYCQSARSCRFALLARTLIHGLDIDDACRATSAAAQYVRIARAIKDARSRATGRLTMIRVTSLLARRSAWLLYERSLPAQVAAGRSGRGGGLMLSLRLRRKQRSRSGRADGFAPNAFIASERWADCPDIPMSDGPGHYTSIPI